MHRPTVYRSIWISDLHLGTRDCKADLLLDFLRYNDSRHLYLVGDIVDGWALRRSWYWPQLHNDVIQKVLRKARKGTRVVYVPGNHDEFARHFLNTRFGGITVRPHFVHTTWDGRRLLVLHGDQFDGVIGRAKWLSLFGSYAYTLALRSNLIFNRARRALGMPYWSLSAYLKQRTKQAVQFIADFEDAVRLEAEKHDVEGVICGHIHHAELRSKGDLLYANTGDWVESCTALVEHLDGRLEIIRWSEASREEIVTSQAAGGDGYDSVGDVQKVWPVQISADVGTQSGILPFAPG